MDTTKQANGLNIFAAHYFQSLRYYLGTFVYLSLFRVKSLRLEMGKQPRVSVQH